MQSSSSHHEAPDTSSVPPPPPPSDGAPLQDHALLPQSIEHPYVSFFALVIIDSITLACLCSWFLSTSLSKCRYASSYSVLEVYMKKCSVSNRIETNRRVTSTSSMLGSGSRLSDLRFIYAGCKMMPQVLGLDLV